MNQIESIGNSAAATLCQLSRAGPFKELHNHFMGDIVGLVALLGRVNSTKLSRYNPFILPFAQLKDKPLFGHLF